jgi:hypothetical protein
MNAAQRERWYELLRLSVVRPDGLTPAEVAEEAMLWRAWQRALEAEVRALGGQADEAA